jgi:hypothetical protein
MRVAQAVTHFCGELLQITLSADFADQSMPFKAPLGWSYNPPLNAIGVPELQIPIIATAIAIFGLLQTTNNLTSNRSGMSVSP